MRDWIQRRKPLWTLVVVLLLVAYLWPISLGSRIPEEKPLVITWTELSVLPPAEGESHSSLHNEATSYRLEAGTAEREEFQALLEGYSIHRTWRTPFPANGLNGHSNGGYLLICWTEEDQFVHQVVTGFDRLVMVDDHIYSLGYLNKHLSLDMKERMLAFLGHCTPVTES